MSQHPAPPSGPTIAIGVAAGVPAGLEASTLTPQSVHAASPAIQSQVADLYGGVLAPVFLALAIVYAVGIVAAVLLPAGRLSDEHDPQTTSTASSEPVTA